MGRIVTFLPAPFAFAGTMCLGPGAFGPNPSLGPTGADAFERGAAGTMCLGPGFLGPAAGTFVGNEATSSIASTCSLFALLLDLALSSMAFVLGALNDCGLCLTSSSASVRCFTDLECALSAIACVSVLADLERACCLGSAFFADLVLARDVVVVGASASVVVSFGADLALDLLLALAAAAGLSSAFFCLFCLFGLLGFLRLVYLLYCHGRGFSFFASHDRFQS